MISKAKSKFVRISPYKLRPIVNVIRGNRLDRALAWLKATSKKKTQPILKILISAFANAEHSIGSAVSAESFYIKEIRVDQGPTVKYFKPGAMGRACVQRKRLSHLEVVLEMKEIANSEVKTN